MDVPFKFYYTTYMFSLFPRPEKVEDWITQVVNINDFWEPTGKLISKTEFYKYFERYCADLSLPAETYDLENAFQAANKEWRVELMLEVGDRLMKWWYDDVPLEATNIICWNVDKEQMDVDPSIRKLCEQETAQHV